MKKITLFIICSLILLIVLSSFITAPTFERGEESLFGDYVTDLLNSWAGVNQWRNLAQNNKFVNPVEEYWYPVDPWEIQQCKQDLSTQVWDSKGASSPDNANMLLFDLTITLQAQEKNISYDNKAYQLSISWYVQHYKEDITYSIQLKNEKGQWVEVPQEAQGEGISGPITNKKASYISGDAGFLVLNSQTHYTHIRIVSDEYSYDVPIIFTGI